MTEIMVVIGIIVLILAIGVPAFNLIRGGRSVDSAENQVAAMISRARANAIGLQKAHGVMFVKNLAEDRFYVVEVIEAPYPTEAAAANRQVYLDLTDTEFLPLPPGVGVQTLNNKPATGVDNYLGFNQATVALTDSGSTAAGVVPQWAYGGVILFNGQGQLISKSYGFRTILIDPAATPPADKTSTLMDNLLIQLGNVAQNPGEAASDPAESGMGLVLYELEAFRNNGNDGDPQLTGALDNATGKAAETAEENWISSNALFLMVNRYNGTLTRAN